MNAETRVLLIGYGNPGRLDDGLGPALAERFEKLGLPGVTVDANYQLNVEDAADLAEHDVVIFADADVSGPEPFWFRRIEPKRVLSFTTHSVAPDALLGLAEQLFDARGEAFILGIRGYRFNEFGEGLSPEAQENLDAAAEFLEAALRDRVFTETPRDVERHSVTSEPSSIEDETCRTENT